MERRACTGRCKTGVGADVKRFAAGLSGFVSDALAGSAEKGIGIPQRAEDLIPLSDLPLEVTWAAMEKLQ